MGMEHNNSGGDLKKTKKKKLTGPTKSEELNCKSKFQEVSFEHRFFSVRLCIKKPVKCAKKKRLRYFCARARISQITAKRVKGGAVGRNGLKAGRSPLPMCVWQTMQCN